MTHNEIAIKNNTEPFEVTARWSRDALFTAQIEIGLSSRFLMLGAAVKWALQTGANLKGADLRDADLEGADLKGAVLTGAYMRGAYMKDADLTGAYMKDADLAGAYMAGADLTGAYMTGAVLTGTDLTDAVLTDAVLTDAPVIPNIDAAILSAIAAGGRLDMATWHTCATAHCRAGWAITLAGEAGAILESRHGAAAAGALIYAVSRPGKPLPNFYASDAVAMADLIACAGDAA